MAVSSRAAAAWCEQRSHECPAEGRRTALDGGVTGSRALRGRSKCSRNMFPIIVYSFTAHNHRVSRVRNGRPREAARSVAVPSPAAASTGLSPVRRRASTEHLGSAPGGPSQPPCPACTPSRPKFRANAASVAPWLRSPAKLLSLRGQPFSPGSIAFTRARISRFRAALPPRGRWQEVASSIRARPGLPRRWAGAPATGPSRRPGRTRGRGGSS